MHAQVALGIEAAKHRQREKGSGVSCLNANVFKLPPVM